MSRRWLLLLASLPLGGLLFVAAATGGPPVDTTPPVIVPNVSPSPNGAGWNHTDVTVTWDVSDGESPFISSGCDPSLLSSETTGTTLTCEATSLGGTASESVTIKIDKTAPTVSGSDPAPVEATGPSTPVALGATPSDNFDSDPVFSCAPPGPSYPRGITPVECTATDDAGNTTSPAVVFNVTVTDTTAPEISGLTNQTLEATGPAGATASYSPSASDLVDGSVPVTCSPSSPHTFSVAGSPHTVECTAQDNATPSNVANGSFKVTVTDSDPDTPEFSPAPPNISVEANGPAGSVVFYGPITATDPQEGAIVATCSPASGATFAVGTTPVSCTATDGNGNSGASGFTITVQDTTAPILVLPGNPIIQSPTPVAASTTVITSFLASASAIDLVDTSPGLTHNAPSSFPVGLTGVTFTATDDAGNTATATRFVNVVTTPTPGAVLPSQSIPPEIQPDAPPANVQRVAAKLSHRSILLSWTNPADTDFDHVEIMRAPGKRGAEQSLVYRGAVPRFRDDSLAAGQEYRYLLISIDKKGNRAVGVALVVVARAQLLLAPKDEARLKAPPLLRWKPIGTADYYNVQLFRGKTKLLSVWPVKPSYKLRARWRYGGKSFRLLPGFYTWFVWPGEGPKARADYGDLLGEGHFKVVKKAG